MRTGRFSPCITTCLRFQLALFWDIPTLINTNCKLQVHSQIKPDLTDDPVWQHDAWKKIGVRGCVQTTAGASSLATARTARGWGGIEPSKVCSLRLWARVCEKPKPWNTRANHKKRMAINPSYAFNGIWMFLAVTIVLTDQNWHKYHKLAPAGGFGQDAKPRKDLRSGRFGDLVQSWIQPIWEIT